MTRRAAVIGLDGAAWPLIDDMLDNGVMPRLKAIRDAGARGILRSTVPTYTPPAWTSAVTGVNPGRHGIYGFVSGHAQEPGGFMHAGKVQSATLWEMANTQGLRAGIFHLPLTYPARKLDGWMVSGMMTPGYGERPPQGFTSPKALEERIHSWAPNYAIDVSANWEKDYRDDALCKRVIASLHQRVDVLRRLLDDEPVDVVFSVLESPDRLQHVYYRYMDPNDDMYYTPEAKRLRPEIWRCFQAMDEIVGLLHDYAGDTGGVVVCSDHGFTAWEVSVHTNALLEQWGYLKLKPSARAMQTGLARALVPLAKRVLPAKIARGAKSKTFSAIDWTRTKAFASPIPQQGVFVNLRGRERFGVVDPAELDAIKDDLVRRFQELRGPDGAPVTDVVYRSEDVFSGSAVDGAPDVLPVLREHRYEIDDEIFHRSPFTDLSHLPRGAHHPDGIVIVAGAGIRPNDGLNASVLDVTPTLLYLAGAAVPDGLDGSVIGDAFDPQHLTSNPPRTTGALDTGSRDESSPYSPEEEAMIEESLRGLGYL
ncbi:MAG TPA: alkaline phosphatase family protein [Actinomycetota bacterium]|nr:alkaline phosphatase family protein [Actinomycetota bacterium]